MLSTVGNTLRLFNGFDPSTVCICAKANADGVLFPVDRIEEKIESISRNGILPHIEYLVISNKQYDPQSDPNEERILDKLREQVNFEIIEASDLPDALDQLYRNCKPRLKLQKKAISDFQSLDLKKGNRLLSSKFYILPSLLLPKEEVDFEESAVLGPDPAYKKVSRLGFRDEEEQEQVDYRITSINELLYSKLNEKIAPKIFVLGEVWSGKSEFLRYAARLAAESHLKYLGRTLIPIRIIVSDWRQWRKDNPNNLSTFLESKYGLEQGYLKIWLEKGDLLLLFDGIESLQADKRLLNEFHEAIRSALNCPVIISCRTTSLVKIKQFTGNFDNFREVYLDFLEENQQIDFISAYFNISDNQARQFLEGINNRSHLRQSATNPKFLSLLCESALQNNNGRNVKQLQNPQSSILEQVIGHLLKYCTDMFNNSENAGNLTEQKLSIIRRSLERLAFDMQIYTLQTNSLPSAEKVNQFLEKSTQYYLDNKTELNLEIKDIIRFFLIGGLLIEVRKDNKEYFGFWSDLIQNYLSACYLSRSIEYTQAGIWASEFTLGSGKKISLHQIVDWFSWQKEYNLTLLFLIGKLIDPFPLLDDLINPEKDDLFMHRRALAACCLLEVGQNHRREINKIRDNLAPELFEMWFSSCPEFEDLYFTDAIQALILLESRFNNTNVDAYVAQQIENRSIDENKNQKITQTLKLYRSTIDNGGLILTISRLLGNLIQNGNGIGIDNNILGINAINAISALGQNINDQEIFKQLAELLRNPRYQRRILYAISEFGGADSVEVIKNEIINLLEQVTNPDNNSLLAPILIAVSRLKMGQNRTTLPLLMGIMTKTDFFENDRCLALLALAETDWGNLHKKAFEKIRTIIFDQIRDSKDRRNDYLVQVAVSRAIQNTSQPEMREILTEWLTEIRDILFCRKQDNAPKLLTDSELYKSIVEEMAKIQDLDILDQDFKEQLNSAFDNENYESVVFSSVTIIKLLELLESGDDTTKDEIMFILSDIANLSSPSWMAQILISQYIFGNVETRRRIAKILGEFKDLPPNMLEAISIRLKNENEDEKVIQNTLNSLQAIGTRIPQNNDLLDVLIRFAKTRVNTILDETREELKRVLTELVGKAVKEGNPSNEATQVLIDLFDLSGLSQVNSEVCILQNQGLRFFRNSKNGLYTKTVKELVTS